MEAVGHKGAFLYVQELIRDKVLCPIERAALSHLKFECILPLLMVLAIQED